MTADACGSPRVLSESSPSKRSGGQVKGRMLGSVLQWNSMDPLMLDCPQ